jgi:hypothetical protein
MNFGSADGPSFSLVCCALLFSLCPMSLSLAPQTGEVTYVTSKNVNDKGGPLFNATAKTNANGKAVFISPPINATSSDGCNITVLQPSDGGYVLDLLHSDMSGGKLTRAHTGV